MELKLVTRPAASIFLPNGMSTKQSGTGWLRSSKAWPSRSLHRFHLELFCPFRGHARAGYSVRVLPKHATAKRKPDAAPEIRRQDAAAPRSSTCGTRPECRAAGL